jgi:hypothetical protein
MWLMHGQLGVQLGVALQDLQEDMRNLLQKKAATRNRSLAETRVDNTLRTADCLDS